VHGANGHGCGSGGGEDEVQLASDVDDEELAERDSSEETEEGAHEGDCDDATEILLGLVGEETELVHGWETGNEETGKTTGTSGRGLDDGVLLGTEVHANVRDLGEDLGKDLNLEESLLVLGLDRIVVLESGMTYNTETKDGTEHGSRESETGLQTEVDIGRIDERTEQNTDDDGTRCQRVRLINDTLQRREAAEEIGDGLIDVGRLRLEIIIDGLWSLLVGVSGVCNTPGSGQVVLDGISGLLVVADGGELGVPAWDTRVGVHDE
jgi:hypothetical protein